ncbi:MAG: hypothetical protein O7G86_11995 [Gammaproteobacteria bacterium]|nr:hypothetical protein [Gammaproteobacteria bacterium]
MNVLSRISLGIGLLSLAGSALAIDTSNPILCASLDVNECVDGAGCREVLAEEVNAPTFFRIDMKKMEIRVTKDAQPTKIELSESLEGRIVMQGIEDGNPDVDDGTGWTISIEEDTGRMVATAAIRQGAVVIFGACIEL